MKISEVKQEFQLQEWSGMLREQKESGLSVKAWCQEHGMAEHIYYYRLRKLRQAACTALEQAQPLQLAEVPLAPKQEESHAKLRLTTNVLLFVAYSFFAWQLAIAICHSILFYNLMQKFDCSVDCGILRMLCIINVY